MRPRDYERIAQRVARTGDRAARSDALRDDERSGDAVSGRPARMRAAVDALWDGLRESGVSWVGFYYHDAGAELVLGPCRDQPACSPIGLHGVCGEAFTTGRPVVVPDVRARGAAYVACDPRDRSEVVIPLFDADRQCWGVLDLDSHQLGAFTAADVIGLQQVVRAAELSL